MKSCWKCGDEIPNTDTLCHNCLKELCKGYLGKEFIAHNARELSQLRVKLSTLIRNNKKEKDSLVKAIKKILLDSYRKVN